jgi:hypothetical protein
MNKTKIYLIAFVCLCISTSLQAQWWKTAEDAEKERSKGMLLLTAEIQNDATEAINKMYNYKFAEAEKEFKWLKMKYPEHPLPNFLMGLSEWWKIVPNTENRQYDSRCLMYMDSSIVLAEKIYDLEDSRKVEAAFIMAASYAFKGRIHAERKSWGKAVASGKNALKYFKLSKGHSDLSPELVFGDGMYNYYAEWIPQNYGALKPIFWFFPNGNKPNGIKQLEQVSYNAFYTRTEARYFLLQIYGLENQNDKAYELAKYTYQAFPDNPFFHRYYARSAFITGHMKEAETAAKEILKRVNEGTVGYEGVSGRYATYILAYYNHLYYHNMEDAKKYYWLTIDYAQKTKSEKSAYYWASLLNLGKIVQQEGDYENAAEYFKQVLDDADKKSSQYEEAKKMMVENKKLKKKKKK